MKKGFIYISILAAAVLASCVKNPVGERTLSGTGEKTPIVVVSNVNANTSVTKAVDGRWETNDMMFAYVQHVVSDGLEPPSYTLVNVAGTEPRIQYFKVGTLTDGHHNVANNFNQTEASKLTPVNAGGTAVGFYWDDFSVGGMGDENDIRTTNHGLRSFYGLCYNGGPAYGQAETHISTNLADAAGTLGWTVSSDQSVTNAFKYSDLLFSPTQTPVAYTHGSNNTINGRDNVLSIPFTHAMSKVTIEVICDEGFDTGKNNFENAVVKLQNMNTVATVTAPEAKLSAFATPAEITTLGVTHLSTPNVNKSFTALIAPTVFKAGIPFAKIEGVDGNTYDLVLTDAVIDAKEDDVTKPYAWSTQLAGASLDAVNPSSDSGYNAENGGLTKPGVHYMITVTIKKQQIKVSAIIQDWDAVSAEGIGQIQFATDVKTIETDPKVGDDGISAFSASFDLYKEPMFAAEYGKKASTVSWSSDHWEYTPKIYWQNKYDLEYFRALSGAPVDDPDTEDVNESLSMSQGTDVLWGTTAAHKGKDLADTDYEYSEGAPIHPRTTYVPLIFRHIMSKITVNLVDDLAGSSDPGATLNLAGATIQFTNMAKAGTIELNMGGITAGALSAKMLSEDGGSKRYGFYAANDGTKTSEADELVKLKDYVVVPQAFTDRVAPAEDAYIIITLADGTTYKLKLNTCKTLVTAATDETPAVYEDINKWERGKHYTYTIGLAKEQITFRAMIKDWVEKTGSGNANLEWD